MPEFPKVIVSSVIRSAYQGESHGGVYIVDLATDSFEQVIDWNDQAINWEGRGLDRGLRGISINGDQVYLAASDEIFVYDRNFNRLESYRNPYLKHCHEIYMGEKYLYVTSTGFDSILLLDLETGRFVKGYTLRFVSSEQKLHFSCFDPNSANGPLPGDTIHINNVHGMDEIMFASSLGLDRLFYIRKETLFFFSHIPTGTHNARPYVDGVLLNDTQNDKVSYLDLDGQVIHSSEIKHYPENDLQYKSLPKDHARQGFARGLCIADNDLIIGGSSPATISVYRLGTPRAVKTVNLTMDVRNSIHGLEIWPS